MKEVKLRQKVAEDRDRFVEVRINHQQRNNGGRLNINDVIQS